MVLSYSGVVTVRTVPASFFFQAEDGIRYLVRSRGLGDVYKRQSRTSSMFSVVRANLKRKRPSIFFMSSSTARASL